ncbi:hypothetical protein PBAC_07680 [Pedobacter glucosidilyticus]|nr:hypothetical protein [Pedobacter glucosidilyticus]KHJ39168.1 hypothetical protein PBAC_07680 [Pedobacter glucosidilyticus]
MLKYLVLLMVSLGIITSCNSVNQSSSVTVKDSINAISITDTSILIYTEGLLKLKDSFEKLESPVYSKGDYAYFYSAYKKDGEPVIYQEYGDSGAYGFQEKTYFLEDGEIVLFTEKSKLLIPESQGDYQHKESRYFYRNGIFLKAEEKSAANDSALHKLPFVKLDENLADEKKVFDFTEIENALQGTGKYVLTFNKLNTLNTKQYLMLSNNNLSIDVAYLIKTPDSLINDIALQPALYKGKKLNIQFEKQGKTLMIYKSGSLAN